MKKKYGIIGLILILFLFRFMASGQTYNDAYNLLFQDTSGLVVGDIFIHFLQRADYSIDTAVSIREKHPFKITYWPVNIKDETYMNVSISSIVVLPDEKVSKYEVVLHTKGKDIDEMVFTVVALDGREEPLAADSVKIGSGDWREYPVVLKGKNAKALLLKINYRGDENKNQTIWLDRIIVKADGKELNDLPVYKNMQEVKTFDRSRSIELSEGSSNGTIYDNRTLKGKKIIGLGESVSGSQEIIEATYKMMKNMIEKDACRLVVVDEYAERSFFVDLYIQGLVGEQYKDEIERIILESTSEEWDSRLLRTEFIEWLRNYNKTATRKVHWVGMKSRGVDNIKLYLFGYFRAILAKEHSKEYLKDVYNGDFAKLYSSVSDDSVLQSKLGEESFNYLLSLIKICTQDLADSYRLEDDKMFTQLNNAVQIYVKEGEFAIVKAPATTLSKGVIWNDVFFGEKRLGYYLNELFGKDYYTICFVAGEGSYAFSGQLSKAPLRSVEGWFSTAGQVGCFYPAKAIPKEISMMRAMEKYRKYSSDDFVFCSPAREFDAFVFIGQNTPVKDLIRFGVHYEAFSQEENDEYLQQLMKAE